MKIETDGRIEPDEAAAIIIALHALTNASVAPEPARPTSSAWRLAARAFDDGIDAERARRRAKRRAS